MSQPSYVPFVEADQVRPAYRMRTPEDWRQGRVAELRNPDREIGREMGTPGPDQGYAMLLADEIFAERVETSDGVRVEDALAGCVVVASARAALYGRAPVAKDVELALTLFGFLGGAPADLVAWRTPRFQAVAHHYHDQRKIADAVPESTLRLAPAAVRAKLAEWRSLIEVA